MYIAVCIISMYNVIFLTTIFEKPITNAKNTLNSMEFIQQNWIDDNFWKS
jgi:hypothetical protein